MHTDLSMCAFCIDAFSNLEAVSNQPIHWGFAKSKEHKPADAGKELTTLLKKYDAFYLGNTKRKRFILHSTMAMKMGTHPKSWTC